MRKRIECRGTVRVPLPVKEAFTPEGERRWVDGWSPTYPTGARPDITPGLVFEVGKEEGASTWVVAHVDADARTAAYVYVVPSHRAVLVDVAAAPDGEGTRIRVTYHMTAHSPEAYEFVRAFADGYDAFLEGWASGVWPDLTARIDAAGHGADQRSGCGSVGGNARLEPLVEDAEGERSDDSDDPCSRVHPAGRMRRRSGANGLGALFLGIVCGSDSFDPSQSSRTRGGERA